MIELISPVGLVNHTGEPIDIVPSAGRQAVLYFMRTANCSACRKHIKELIRVAAHYAANGVDIVVIVPDGPDAANELHSELALPFPVATSSTFHEAVGLSEKIFGKVRQSGVFLIEDSGTVLYQRASTLPPMSMKIDEVTAAIG